MNTLSRSIRLTPRNERFEFQAGDRRDWHGGDPVKSILFNAFSILFPEGERFFMDSVKAVRPRVNDPVLLEQIKGFLAQEAMHTREHVDYNRQLDQQGFRATQLHLKVRDRISWVRKHLGPERQLAATCALEHFTAIMADLLMKDPAFLEGADERFRKVWLWHALEEAEHKGVAFDVYQHITGGRGYFRRTRTMIIVTLTFNLRIFMHVRWMMGDVGLAWSPTAWGRMAWFLFGKPGFFRRMFIPWLEYFTPGFHPWKHDNRKRLAVVETELLGRSNYSEAAA